MTKRRSSKKRGTALERILENEPGISIKLKDAPLAEDSIFNLQRKTTAALMAHYPTLHISEAKRLSARLDVASAAMMRAFREKRLRAGGGRPANELKGPLALSQGPTFENQFSPSWSNNAHPQAVDATTSPAAYLIDMLAFVEEFVESQADSDKALTLRGRRPDLFELLIDARTMNREVTQVEVVNRVLEYAVEEQRRQTPNDLTAVEDKLLQVRRPLKLFPYEAYWQQIRTVLTFNKLQLSDVSRLSDVESPYFIQPGAHSEWSDAALAQDSSLGPALRAILTEGPYFGTGSEALINPQTRQLLSPPQTAANKRAEQDIEIRIAFFEDNFGMDYSTLQNVVNFRHALQMTQQEMNALFGLGDYSPIRSEHVGDSSLATADLFGARFINSGGTEPVSVVRKDRTINTLTFLALSEQRCDRVNRLVRLAHAMQLTYPQADQLVCAIIDAEKRAVASVKRLAVNDAPLWMSFNTLRGLGLFQFLRERFDCSAEDFAALMSDMAIYGVGDTLSHFDRVFNLDTTTPLVLDGKPFNLAGEDAESKMTVDQLCRGLGINMETFRYLSRMVLQSQGSESLHRTLGTVSAFYRVTRLAKLLSITTIELLSLLEVVSPEGLYALQLAGVPQNAMYMNSEQTDTVSVIHAIGRCVLWTQEQQLPIGWLVQQLLPVETADVVPEDIRALFTELKSHLLPFQDFDRLMQEAGVRPLKSASWQTRLKQVVDDDGLITDTGNSEEDFDPLLYENFVEREIAVVIAQLQKADPATHQEGQLPELTTDEADRLKALILGVVLRIRSQQWGVVQERLSHLLALNADLVIPVIYWAQGTAHALLATATAFQPDQPQSADMKAIMPLIQRMQRCARVATQFALSPAFFSSFLAADKRSRFSVNNNDLTLHTLYFLEQYKRCLGVANQSEEQLLGYFTLIEALGEMSDNERRLITDAAAEKLAAWLGWGIREVLDVAGQVSTDGIIRNLAQLCVLTQTRQLCEQTELSAISLIKLSRLSSHSTTQVYRDAAQEMLSSLYGERQQRRDEAELRQSLSVRCQVREARLIARAENQETLVTLTLLDMNNQPLSGIRVRWSTDLGKVLANASYTDVHGVASVGLAAGNTVGVAHVQAFYGLDSVAFAPPITIDCDEDSLDIEMTLSPGIGQPWPPAGNKGVFILTAHLSDKYGNPGADRLINWASEVGEFVGNDGETLTDSGGYSRITLRSLQPAKGIVLVWYADGNRATYEVGFSDEPYISALVVTSATVLGNGIDVSATVMGLGGEGVAGQKLRWTCEGGEIVGIKGDTSGAAGNARAVFTADAPGEATITVELLNDEVPPQPFFSKQITFEVLPDAVLKGVRASEHWPIADGIDAAEWEVHIATSTGKPVERYPVKWRVEEVNTFQVTVLTDAQGIARYERVCATQQPRTAIADCGQIGEHKFATLTFMPELNLVIEVDEVKLNGPIILAPREKTYTLTYQLPDKHPLLEQPMQLLYDGRASDISLGLTFTPGLGLDKSFTGGKVTWTIKCDATALSKPANLRLGLSNQKLEKTLWTAARVDPEQPSPSAKQA